MSEIPVIFSFPGVRSMLFRHTGGTPAGGIEAFGSCGAGYGMEVKESKKGITQKSNSFLCASRWA